MNILKTEVGAAPINMFVSARSWIEGNALQQLEQLSALAGTQAITAMPDLHPGKFGPVGCAVLADRLYPELIGSDIGCGMGLFQFDIAPRKLKLDKLAARMRALETPWDGDIQAVLKEAGLAATSFDASLGSIGGGNHFCEIQAIEEIIESDAAARAGLDPANAYALVHSGSRGLGYSILQRHLTQGERSLALGSEAAERYLSAHDHAVAWAKLNRRTIAERAAFAARAEISEIADLSHNLLEAGSDAMVLHRKGAAPADRGLVPIPGSRGTLSYLVEPREDFPAEALASLAHGAGRKYDRASMHGRIAGRKSDLSQLGRNPYGGVVLCEERRLLIEEAPAAYKSIEQVIGDLVEFGLVRVVATFRPLLTFKTVVERAEDSARTRRGKTKREVRR